MPKPENDSLRRCLVTRTSQPKDRLVRFVTDHEGRVTVDLAARLPGRGMWLSASRDVVNKAVGRNVFARAAGRAVASPDLADELESLLAARLLDDVGLARRAGQIVIGFEKVRAAVTTGAAALLLEASDGAQDGERKLRRLAPHLPCIKALSRRELGRAVGRDDVVHAAVTAGGLARRMMIDGERLAGFRPGVLEREWSPAQVAGGETQMATGSR